MCAHMCVREGKHEREGGKGGVGGSESERGGGRARLRRERERERERGHDATVCKIFPVANYF